MHPSQIPWNTHWLIVHGFDQIHSIGFVGKTVIVDSICVELVSREYPLSTVLMRLGIACDADVKNVIIVTNNESERLRIISIVSSWLDPQPWTHERN